MANAGISIRKENKMTDEQLVKRIQQINIKAIREKNDVANTYLAEHAKHANSTKFKVGKKEFITQGSTVRIVGKTAIIVYYCICVASRKASDIGVVDFFAQSTITKNLIK